MIGSIHQFLLWSQQKAFNVKNDVILRFRSKEKQSLEPYIPSPLFFLSYNVLLFWKFCTLNIYFFLFIYQYIISYITRTYFLTSIGNWSTFHTYSFKNQFLVSWNPFKAELTLNFLNSNLFSLLIGPAN